MRSYGFEAQRAARIHTTLRNRLLNELAASDLPVLYYDEHKQVGKDFAHRITNAVSDAFTRGYTKLIVLGGDSPDLQVSDILAAYAALQAGKQVVGRDFRGGTYLFGLHAAGFRQNEFRALPWQTDKLADALVSLLGTCCELTHRHDLNTGSDLKEFLPKLRGQRAWSFLFEEIQPNTPSSTVNIPVALGFGESLQMRGPPTAQAS